MLEDKVNWREEFKKVLGPQYDIKDFTRIQFYDYTKDPLKVVANDMPNYHLTFSYSGGNWYWCERFLREKLANVAVVFKNVVPLSYKGFSVVNGDESDERFLDQKGVIVGLKYKKPKGVPYQPNKFVVE
jgi:hypothetical protein